MRTGRDTVPFPVSVHGGRQRRTGFLTTDFSRVDECPYFLWSQDVSVAQFRDLLRSPEPDARAQWMARLLRDARYPDVWRFVALGDVRDLWDRIEPRLGRRRSFWRWLFESWRDDGLLG